MAFIPVTEIRNLQLLLNNVVASDIIVGNTYTLSATVDPSNATNRAITWSIVQGTNLATITGNQLKITGAGAITIRATITNGKLAS